MTTESQPLIDCRNVRKIFPDSAGVPFAAVDDVSFRLSAGEIVGLLGPDGAENHPDPPHHGIDETAWRVYLRPESGLREKKAGPSRPP